jgi:hypothetical protein
MVRAGAPASWTPLMRLVAMEIADDARDPSQGSAADGGYPWSAIPVEGRRDRRGKWKDGLTERCGMSARAVSRVLTELSAAGYEMRQPIGTDKRGRPVFAAKGHATRFRVLPLMPRREPPEGTSRDIESSPDSATYDPESSPDPATYEGQRSPILVPKVAEFGDPIPPGSPQEDLSPHIKINPPIASATQSPVTVEGTRARPDQDHGDVDHDPWALPDEDYPRASPRARQSQAQIDQDAFEEQRRQAQDALTRWEQEQASANGSGPHAATGTNGSRPAYGWSEPRAVCPVCRQDVAVMGTGMIRVHGPRSNPCPGSRKAPAQAPP